MSQKKTEENTWWRNRWRQCHPWTTAASWRAEGKCTPGIQVVSQPSLLLPVGWWLRIFLRCVLPIEEHITKVLLWLNLSYLNNYLIIIIIIIISCHNISLYVVKIFWIVTCVFLLWKALITVIQVFQFSAVKIKYITAEYPEGNTSCLLHHSSFQNPVQKVWLLLPFNINEISSRVQVSLLWWLPHHVWAQLQLSGNTFALKTNVCLLQAVLACVGCWTCPYMSSWNINMSK